MKFFVSISLFSALLLGITVQSGLQKTVPPPRKVPAFLQSYKHQVKDSFERPENANMLFSFITGDKNGISPYTKKSFKKVNLSFLLSPSGIHLTSILFLFVFFIKKIRHSWIKKIIHFTLLSTLVISPLSDSVKRLSVLRILMKVKFLAKLKISLEPIFILTFVIAYLAGDYQRSPLGYIYSLFFLGTFFSLKTFSKLTLIMGLYSTQLILGLFMGEKVSLLSIPLGMLGSFIFSFIFPILILFLSTFWLIPLNWAEPIIRSFIVLVQVMAKFLNGSFTSSSFFLIMAVWTLMIMKFSKRKCALIILSIFLHTNTAMTPVIIY